MSAKETAVQHSLIPALPSLQSPIANCQSSARPSAILPRRSHSESASSIRVGVGLQSQSAPKGAIVAWVLARAGE